MAKVKTLSLEPLSLGQDAQNLMFFKLANSQSTLKIFA